MRRFFVILFLLLMTLAQVSVAQEAGRTILVLDGSGSMWGQIDKKAKITIAQEVIGELLETIPEGTELGLTVYGHRRKGSCKDIETLVEPGTDTRAAIAKAVNRIKPKGKTPLSAAVIAAAEHLKYTEEKATVILISDGRETCKLDPCEVGRKLEETGVDFTAHVIGFDVAKAEDRTQLQCLADATGGRFLTAANAAELSEALKVVSAPAPASEPPPPPPPPQPGHVRFIAIDGDGGPRLTEDLAWTVTNDESGALVADRLRADQLDLALLPGRYRAEVRRLGNETTAVAEIGVTRSTDTTVTLVLPPVLPEATLRGPKLAKAGETVEVEWTGPNEAGDYVAISKSEGGKTGFMATSATKNGSPLTIRMPPENGPYFLHYVLSSRNIVIATTDVEVLTVDASVSIQDSAAAGETVPMEWTGPGYKSDYISIAALNSPGAKTLAYTYASTGSPTKITMPTKPGEYEARYVMALGDTVLFRKKITVTPVSATLQAPQTATAGSDVRISWKGPDYALDFVSVAEPGTRGFDTINYTYTRDGNPLVVTMPVKPGNYELRYVLHQGNAILQTRPISVTEVTASLDAPDTALAGSDVKVAWTGPDYALDYISVAEPGSDGFKAVNFTYSRDGTPLRVTMPTKPGTYELRYVLHQGNEILASRQITVTGVAASLVAPDIAVAGADVDVTWTGPDYTLDFISVAEPGTEGKDTINYTYTRDGSPLKVVMPTRAGTYELRYVVRQNKSVLAARSISVTEVTASLDAPDKGTAGATVTVTWSGPDYALDFISLAKPGSRGSKAIRYVYTHKGSPLRVKLPDRPGKYEIRYVLHQDKKIIAKSAITVE